MRHYFHVYGLSLLLSVGLTYAQGKDNLSDEVNIDNLGENTDEFQEFFFKAIAERAVENPEKAIEALKKCLGLKPNSTPVFYELAKNNIDLKAYEEAEDYLKKTLADPQYASNINIHKQLFYVYSMQKRYDDAIAKARFIAPKNPLYYQELANLYLIQKQYKKALEALNQFDEVEGYDEFRDDFRMLIYEQSELFEQGISYFETRFENSKDDTRAATYLMKLHRLNNSPRKAISVGKKIEENHSNLPLLNVEMALAYLVTKDILQAEFYSQKVVESLTLEEKDKIKVINTFKALALNNPEAQAAFVRVLDSALSTEKNSSSKAELGEFYKSRDKDKALENYKSALRNKPNDFKLIKNILELEMELGKFGDLLDTSEKALESFPSQAFLFFAKGLALNKLERHDEAVEVLEEGLDYIFDNDSLKKQSFEVLKASYLALEKPEQAKAYEQKLILLN